MSRRDAYPVFFPMAALYGALVVPMSTIAIVFGWQPFPGIANPAGHAHELLLGYTLAVMTGFLLNRVPSWWVYSLLLLWIGSRVSYLMAPASLVANGFNALYLLGFAAAGASRFLPSAKKWRNKAFALVIIAIAVIAIALIVNSALIPLPTATHMFVLLVSLMILMMSGRILAPAVAGHLDKKGIILEARVQPGVEAALILLTALAIILLGTPLSNYGAGPVAISAGVLTFVRLARWKLWHCSDRLDLLALAAGYSWVGVGLILFGAALVLNIAPTTALHALTAGAIGTLTLVVMSRVWLQRSRQELSVHTMTWVVAIVGASTLIRLTSPLFHDWTSTGYMLAASLWSAACLIVVLLVFFKPSPDKTGRRVQAARTRL